MTQKFKKGDRVVADKYGNATVLGYRTVYLLMVETDACNSFDHDCDGLAAKGNGYGLYITPSRCTLISPTSPASKPKHIRPGTQNGMLLAHLLEGRTITRIQADHLYRIASLTRRIRDLKDAGHRITSTTKVDPTGRPYVEYALRNVGRVR